MPDTGQWSLPFGPFTAMAGNAEIAHAALLPPPSGQPDLCRVVFLGRSNCPTIQSTQLRSFLWKPYRSPGVVTVHALPSLGLAAGAAEPFCGGNVFDKAGGWIVAGGLDYATWCGTTPPCVQSESAVGHEVVYRLDTSADPPVWVDDAVWPAMLQRKHYYPAVFEQADGTMVVTGHTGAPHPDPDGPGPGQECAAPYPFWPGSFEQPTEKVFEIFDPITGLSSVAANRELASPTACAAPPDVISTGNYGRFHLLSTNSWLHANARIDGVPPGQEATSRVVRVDVPPCPGELRWQRLTSAQLPIFVREGGSSVHLLVRDLTQPDGVRDIVYAIGGIDGRDDEPCEDASSITNSVQRLRDPDALQDGDWTDAVWESMAPMDHRRVNHNAVVLPTGEILVLNGTNQLCQPVFEAEGFRPPEIFGGPTLGEWRDRASNIRPREYHAVAVLLPDGRVIIAGGDAESYPGHAVEVYHTAEIFSPAYYFSGQRPQITTSPPPSSPIQYLSTFSIQVALGCSETNSVTRIVLIRNGSATHGFDTGQRYIELDPGPPSGTYPNISFLTVAAPASDAVAPPGYYMLFVVDANGLPSEGRWVKIGS